LKVGIYDKIEHFCQWGTPEDLEEYSFWIDNLKNDSNFSLASKAGLTNYSPETVQRIINYWQAYLNKNNF